MYIHTFALRWVPEMTDEQKQQAKREILALQGKIPGLLATHIGDNQSPRGKGTNFGGVMMFTDRAVRSSAAPIASATPMNRRLNSSRVTGSGAAASAFAAARGAVRRSLINPSSPVSAHHPAASQIWVSPLRMRRGPAMGPVMTGLLHPSSSRHVARPRLAAAPSQTRSHLAGVR